MVDLKIIKIGLDIDDCLDIDKIHKKIIRYKNLVDRYIVYKSAGGKGLHFELYLNKPVNIGESFEIRENLGDCKNRLAFSKADFIRGWDFDILFTYKKIGNTWKRRTFLDEIIVRK